MIALGAALKDGITRLGLRLFSRIGRRPLPAARQRTYWLARPLQRLMRRRARIVARNLELCFPDWNDEQRKQLQREHFNELARSVGEIAYTWNQPAPLEPSIGTVQGLEHLESARQQQTGIILVTGHSCNIELAGRLLCESLPITGVYRPLDNALLEHYQNQARLRYAQGMIPQSQVRDMVRVLRNGGVLWTAMDQDFGPKRSVFAPFFNLPTATARGLIELARLGAARVHPVYPFRAGQNQPLVVEIGPAFEPFPSADPVADLSRYNAFLEQAIRRQPAPYWWLHRRFKTAPSGTAPRYR